MTRILLVLLVFCSAVTQAKEVSGLYEARILVPDQQADSRQLGAQQGLIEVLHKASGFPVDAENPVVTQALEIAEQYLYQFSYERAENLVDSQDGIWLNMQFAQQSVLNVIKRAGLPLWGANRPTVLTWVAIDEGSREVLTEASPKSSLFPLQNAAKRRGLPLILPVYDLEDSIKLPIEQLWGQFTTPILKASDRYGAESVLVARVYKDNNGQWQGKWRFFFADREYEFIYSQENLSDLMLMGLTSAAEVLANAFAIKPGATQKGRVSIQVDGVSDVDAYAKLTQYLERLAITRDVFVSEIKQDKAFYDLTIGGSLQQFKKTLDLDKRLLPTEASEEDVLRGPNLLFFRWAP